MAKKTTEKQPAKMTDELRKKLLGYSMISGQVTLPFNIEIEGVPSEFLPSFSIKSLSVTELAELRSKEDAEDSYYQDMVRSHIMGWTNIIDLSTDEQVEYKGDKNGCDKELYENLPLIVKTEILSFIYSISK